MIHFQLPVPLSHFPLLVPPRLIKLELVYTTSSTDEPKREPRHLSGVSGISKFADGGKRLNRRGWAKRKMKNRKRVHAVMTRVVDNASREKLG
jgi:hypothetical protein